MIQATGGARLVTQHPHLMANYGRLEINIVRGEGCRTVPYTHPTPPTIDPV